MESGFCGNTIKISEWTKQKMWRNQYGKMEFSIQVAVTCVPLSIILFLCAQNCTVSDIHWQLDEVFHENIMSWQMVCPWVHQFYNKKMHDVHDLAWEGRPHSSLMNDSIARVRALLMDDRRLTIGQLEWWMATEVCNPISYGTVYHIVKDKFAAQKVSVRWVPCQLSDKQIHQWMTWSNF